MIMNDDELNHPDENQCTNVYVANLPPTADAPRIREFFADTGKVLHVKLLLDIATGVSRGIAFVMVENLFTARKACLLKNKVVLDGSVLQVRLAERSSQHASIEAHVRSSIVYLRNVPGGTTKEQVGAHCAATFGRVVEVTLHPQSFELNGPSPFNMVFVTFEDVDDACRCVEGVDGKAPFPIPHGHPFTMAKMIIDITGEMRKSILLRRRGSDSTPNQMPKQVHQPVMMMPHHSSPQAPAFAVPSPGQSPNGASLAPAWRPDMMLMYAGMSFAPQQQVMAQQSMHMFTHAPQQFAQPMFQHEQRLAEFNPFVGLVPPDESRIQVQSMPYSPQYVLVPMSQMPQQGPQNIFLGNLRI